MKRLRLYILLTICQWFMTKIIAAVLPPLRIRETTEKKDQICKPRSFMRFYDSLASPPLVLITLNSIFASFFSMFKTPLSYWGDWPFHSKPFQIFFVLYYPSSNKWNHANICTDSSLIHSFYLWKRTLLAPPLHPTNPVVYGSFYKFMNKSAYTVGMMLYNIHHCK